MAIERQHRPIDKEFEEADYTGILDISNRKLRLFPNIGDDIYDVLEVFEAILSENRFDKLPKQIFAYNNLITLDLHSNVLRHVPGDICHLKQLQHLNLSRNYLQQLPNSVCSMHLHSLNLSNNRLYSLPTDIGRLKLLRCLDISCNSLTDLPLSFTDLMELTHFDVRRNELRELPTGIHKLPLSYLDISSNMITKLPVSLRRMTSLSVFKCNENPLELPPAQICVRGLNHVFKYLQEIEKYGSDPAIFATNREESLMRRRRDKNKKASRPTSGTSTFSGIGSEMNERSFIDEMTNFVHSAFGGNDTKMFQNPEVPVLYGPSNDTSLPGTVDDISIRGGLIPVLPSNVDNARACSNPELSSESFDITVPQEGASHQQKHHDSGSEVELQSASPVHSHGSLTPTPEDDVPEQDCEVHDKNTTPKHQKVNVLNEFVSSSQVTKTVDELHQSDDESHSERKLNPHVKSTTQVKRRNDVFKSLGKSDPNYTVRRQEFHIQEELEKVDMVKNEIEVLLSLKLSDDFGEDISSGIILCQLVNKLHPNTISTVHTRQNENLSIPKKMMNITSFIAACKKLGVPEAVICSAGDILDYKDPVRVAACIRGLLNTVNQ